MAQRMRKAAKSHSIEMEIKAVSEAELKDHINSYDMVLVGPHLKYKLASIQEMVIGNKIPVEIIPEEIYGKLDGEALLKLTLEELDGQKIDHSSNETENKEEISSNEVSDGKEEQASEENPFMRWMMASFVPKMNKVTNNKFFKAIQNAILSAMPFIMVGSFVSIVDIARNYLSWIPDLSLINKFSFGLLGLYLAYLIPQKVFEIYKLPKLQTAAILTSLSMFLMLALPSYSEDGTLLQVSVEKLGAGGMLLSLLIGCGVSAIMLLFSKFSFFKKDTTMPDVVVNWTDTLVPVVIIFALGTVIYSANFDIFEVIQKIFTPLFSIAQTLPGILIVAFSVAFLYSFGISSWAVFPIVWAIWMEGIADNISIVSSGGNASNLNTMEFFHGFIYLGGVGCTLVLVLMLMFAKSKQLRTMGKITIIPSLFNINEPVIFGTPVAFNPLLMVPMWIVSIVLPTITYFAFSLDFVAIPIHTFQVWYMPIGLFAYLATNDWKAIILVIINLIVAGLIYYPFFKAYDKQLILEEEN